MVTMSNEERVRRYVMGCKEGTWVEAVARDLKMHRATVKTCVNKMEWEKEVRVLLKGNIKMIYPIMKV